MNITFELSVARVIEIFERPDAGAGTVAPQVVLLDALGYTELARELDDAAYSLRIEAQEHELNRRSLEDLSDRIERGENIDSCNLDLWSLESRKENLERGEVLVERAKNRFKRARSLAVEKINGLIRSSEAA